jgi:hypothetical protein
MGRACTTNLEKMNIYRILVGKPEGRIEITKKAKTYGGG